MDPWCDAVQAAEEHDVVVSKEVSEGEYDAIIIAVAHDEFKKMGARAIRKLGRQKHIIYDLKYVLPKDDVDLRL